MRVSCISDIHAANPNGEAYKLLLKFLDHPLVRSSERISMLGDVFDHLTGEHSEHLQKYQEFFEKTVELLKAGKRVDYIEGNHDFHFGKTFKLYLSKRLSSEEIARFGYHRSGFILDVGDKKAFLCHGDDLDLENLAYRRWKRIYSSQLFGFFISKVMTYKMVEAIGQKASDDSRKRGSESFNRERERKKYRLAAESFLPAKDADIMVSGHTHIKDDHYWEAYSYHNIGFPLKDRSFLLLGAEGVERVPLL